MVISKNAKELITVDYTKSNKKLHGSIRYGATANVNPAVAERMTELGFDFVGNDSFDWAELASETTTTTASETIPLIVAGQLAEAVHERATARKIFKVMDIRGQSGNTVSIPQLNELFSGVGSLAEVTEETATALDTGTALTARVTKYGVRVDVSNELAEDSNQDFLAIGARRQGEALAEYEDRLIYSRLYNQMDDGNRTDKTTGDWSASSGWQKTVTDDITDVIDDVENNDVAPFNPTHLLVNTTLNKYIRRHDDFVDYAKYGGSLGSIHDQKATELHSVGVTGRIYGLDVVNTRNLATSMTRGTGEDSIAVVDANQSVIILDKRPFTVKQHDVGESDEVRITGTIRSASLMLHDKAASWITDVVSPS